MIDITKIADLAKQFYDKFSQMKDNNKTCQDLQNYIHTVVDSLKYHENIADKKIFQLALDDLAACLLECLNYIDTFTEQNKVKKFVMSGKYNEEFKNLMDKLKAIEISLLMGISTKQLITLEQQDQKLGNIKKQEQSILKSLADSHKLFEEQKLSMQDLNKKQAEANAKLDELRTSKYSHMTYDRFLISSSDLKREEVVNNAGPVIVSHGKYKGQDVTINKFKDIDDKTFKKIVERFIRLPHEDIVRCYGACIEKGDECIVFEYMAKGSLDSILVQQKEKFSTLQKIQMSLDIANGLLYIHNRGGTHGNLKTECILVNADNRAKISDLSNLDITISTLMLSTGDSKPFTEVTSHYPPEYLYPTDGKKPVYIKACDVYSYGLILWSLFTGKKLPEKPGFIVDFPVGLDPEIISLINACIAKSPQERIKLPNVIDKLETLKKFYLSAPAKEVQEERAKDIAKRAIQQAVNEYKPGGRLGNERLEALENRLTTLIVQNDCISNDDDSILVSKLADCLQHHFLRNVKPPMTLFGDHHDLTVRSPTSKEALKSDNALEFNGAISKVCNEYKSEHTNSRGISMSSSSQRASLLNTSK